MKILLHILKFRLVSFSRIQGKITPGTLMVYVFGSAVYLFFAAGVFYLSRAILEYLLADVRIGMYLTHRFIFAVLFLFFVSVNVGNIVVSYSTLYKSGETGFLITKPVDFGRIFLIKFLDNFFYSSSTLLLMVIAALSGYIAYFGLPWFYIPAAVVFLILPFMLIAGTLGVITLLIIIRLAGIFGIRKVIAAAASVYAFAVIMIYMFSSPVELVARVFQNFPYLDFYMGYLENPLVAFLPNHWVANAFFWISSGKYWAALWYIYLLNITAVLFLIFAVFLGRKWYYTTWITFLNFSGEFSAKKRRVKEIPFSFGSSSLMKPVHEVLLKRELFLFIREPGQWIHFSVMFFLISLFVMSISGIDMKILTAYNNQLKTLIYLIIYLFNVFLIAALSLRFVFPLVSLEGETAWKIRSAPVSYRRLVFKRLLIYFSVIFAIGQLLNFVSNFRFSFILIMVSQLNTAFATIVLVALNFGMGSAFANYKEKSAVRIASSQGASLTFLFTVIFLVFLIVLMFSPVSIYFYSIDNKNVSPVLPLFYTSIILAVVTAISAYLSISRGMNQLERE